LSQVNNDPPIVDSGWILDLATYARNGWRSASEVNRAALAKRVNLGPRTCP